MNNTFLENKLKEFREKFTSNGIIVSQYRDGGKKTCQEIESFLTSLFHETVEWVKGEVVPEEVGVFDGGYEEWKPRGYSEWRDDVLSRFQTITGKEK